METWRSKTAGAQKVSAIVIPGKRVVVFDVETTGLKPGEDHVIQFSAIKYLVKEGYDMEEEDRRDFYINPKTLLSPKITEITGITNDMLALVQPMEKHFDDVKRFLESADIWVGHNVQFDMRMLDGEADRMNAYIRHAPVMDTLEMARDWLRKGSDVENYKLSTVTTALFPDYEAKFHDSLEDVKATAMIFQYLCREYQNLVENPEKPEGKVPMSVNKAWVFINPRKQSQQRICLALSDGGDGDIFYDIIDKQWGHKSTTAAKKLFARADMEDIERQTLTKYKYPSMDALAKSWLAYRRKNKRA